MSEPAPTKAPPTSERILDAALALFAEKGYDATSMREIAAQVGITKAALYYHFENKADIVRTMLAETERQVAELADWAGAQPSSPDLAREALTRWSDLMQARGLAAYRFAVANRAVIHALSPGDDGGMPACLDRLYAALTPAGASVETRLRIRLALASVNMAGLVGADIDADETEILAAAQQLSFDLLP